MESAMVAGARRDGWFVAVWGGLAIAALLWLPYRFTVAPSFSDSYLFGFNNRAGMAIVGLFGLGITLFAPGFAMSAGDEVEANLLGRQDFYRWLTLMLAVSAAMWWLTRGLGGFDESIYMLDRTRLAFEGRLPNRDFEYPYGMLLLYGPVAIARILRIDVAHAYSLFWLLLNVTGLGLLYRTMRWLSEEVSARAVRRAFALVASFAILTLPCTGVNYSIFRFVLPCFLGVAIYRALVRSQVRAILVVAPSYMLLLLDSPELAIAFAVGMAAYVAVFADMRRIANLATAVATVAMLGAMTWGAAALGVFTTLKAFSTGGFNFPIVPAPHILLFLLGIALCAAYVGRQVRARQPSALLALIAVSAVGVAGALGRCDSGHVFLDPLGITIAAILIGATGSKVGRAFFAAVIIVFLALPLAIGLVKLGAAAKDMKRARTVIREVETTDPQLPPGATSLEAPFGYQPGKFGTVHSARIDEGYYLGLNVVLTPEAVARKVAELATFPDRPLLLPTDYADRCRLDPDLHRRFLQILLLYPYRSPARHLESITEPLCDYIYAHYRLSDAAAPAQSGYGIWIPK